MPKKRGKKEVNALKKQIKQAETHTAFAEKAKQSHNVYIFLLIIIVAVVALVTFLVQKQMNDVTGNVIISTYSHEIYNPKANYEGIPIFTTSQACYNKARQAAQQIATKTAGLDFINTDLTIACVEHTFSDRSTQKFCDVFLATYKHCGTEKQKDFEKDSYFLERDDTKKVFIIK